MIIDDDEFAGAWWRPRTAEQRAQTEANYAATAARIGDFAAAWDNLGHLCAAPSPDGLFIGFEITLADGAVVVIALPTPVAFRGLVAELMCATESAIVRGAPAVGEA